MSGERQKPTQSNKELYEKAQRSKSSEGVNAEIDNIIAAQMAELQESGVPSVFYEPWQETYYRVERGWKGPGGFFGEKTKLAEILDGLWAAKSSKDKDQSVD